MATNKQLESQVKNLTETVAKLQKSNSELRDELVALKNNYTILVNQMTKRLEIIHNTFQSKN